MLSKEVVSGNVVLAVETVGERDAPAIVLCQGLGMRVADWPARLIEGLARDFFVVLVENRDTGRSGRAAVPYTLFDMAADIERVAADLGLDRFAVLGFSMGGMIAQIIAARHPHQVTALVQICSSSGEAMPPFPDEARRRLELTARGFASREETIVWLAEDVAYFAAPETISPFEARLTAIEMVEAGHSAEAYARQYAAICGSGDRSDLLRHITAPALVIAGDSDVCIPPDSSKRAATLMPHAKFVCLEGAGHWIGDAAIETTLSWLVERAMSPQESIDR